MRRDSLFSIAPDTPFLATLCDRVLDGTLLGGWPQSGPFWLSDVTIVLPTRRARLVLADLFAKRLGGATLLPDIRTFGGEQAEEEPFLPPFDAPVPLTPVSPLARTLTLARLVDAWARTEEGSEVLAAPPSAAEVLGLARSLGSVLDDLTIEGSTLSALDDDTGKPELAANWQQTKKLLSIAVEVWPAMLAARQEADAASLRNDRLRRQAKAAKAFYGDRPVIAAGSTGSIPATADLLAAICELPRGTVVLPGLDTSLTAEGFAQLIDPAHQPHGHPQYALASLVRRLGTSPSEVRELAPAIASRTRLVRSALTLATQTGAWSGERAQLADHIAEATAGITVLAARTVDDEARAIAIAARESLANGQTVGIVSADQTLSRRIAEELKRFDIEVDDAAGTPLFQSAAGRLARLALNAAVTQFAPLDLMALLQMRAVCLGGERAEVARTAQLIDLGLLRGQRPAVGLSGLRAVLASNVEGRTRRPARKLSASDGEAIAGLLDRLEGAIAPLSALLQRKQIQAAELAVAIGAAVNALVSGATALPPGMAELLAWSAELASLADEGPSFAPTTLNAVLAALMGGSKVTSPVPKRDDIAIWGRLEARLMNPDLMILAGLNEDIWPEPANPGPWLSRGMRLAAGLEPPEKQQGQAAHDFEMGIGNAKVILAYAERRGTSPALPSRFLQRLAAFVGESAMRTITARGQHYLDLARAVDLAPREPVPATRPLPRPPVEKRPKKLSVTEVETLFRSPYDVYAKHVLGLRKLPPLGEAPDARERGSMIHDVFDRFVSQGYDFSAGNAYDTLMRMAETAFSGLDAIGERRDIWLKRFERAAEEFLAYERNRSPQVAARFAEVEGSWTLPSGFVLTGKADRVDQLHDGTLEILDFKTGSIPTPKAMKAFEAPQLLLEAAMAEAGAFPVVMAAPASALTYVKIGLGPEALVASPFKPREGLSVPEAAEEVSRRLQGHVEALLLSDERVMAARIRPDVARRYRGDYDHLARTDEWTIAAGEDE
ncbi:double-strand break repair protein AddB [Devosia sp.]|uniref:double-strand break repair protein AddB n=1 Tax=Devosia sp. TaxID=1871048 RepID=UPI003BABE303